MKVLFFAPHSALWVHAFPEALVAEALKQSGHDIVYVTCGRQFRQFCVPMNANGLKPGSDVARKEVICKACVANKDLIRKEFGFGGYDLADALDPYMLSEVDAHMRAATPANFLDLVIDGIEVGRAALGTYLLSFKKITLEFSEQEWAVFAIELRNTLYAFYAARVILDREKPDRVIVYSSGYSVNLVFCRAAEARGITHYYMNAGSNVTDRLQKVVLARGHSVQKRLLTYWPAFRAKACGPQAMRYVTDHLLEVLKGRSPFVYSSARVGEAVDIRRNFGIRPGQKILLATMSSYDEMFAAEITGLFPKDYETPFPDQAIWLQTLLTWIEGRRELFLIIRVHPREFPNKRDQVKSEHAQQLEETLRELPENVAVNWPSQGLSLYDLVDETAVCLNAWSSVGKELSLLGIPTVIYSPDLVFYPEDLNYVGKTRETYLPAIERALVDGWSLDKIRLTYRWLALEDKYSRLDIADGFKRSEYEARSLAGRGVSKARRMVNPVWREREDCRRRPPALAAAVLIDRIVSEQKSSVLDILAPADFESVSADEEERNLKVELRRVAEALFGAIDKAGAPGSLRENLRGVLRG